MKLIEGEICTLTRTERSGRQGKSLIKRKERMRLIKKYTNHAQFEKPCGVRISFQYWDINKMLNGEIIE